MLQRDKRLVGYFLVYDLFLIVISFYLAGLVKFGNLSPRPNAYFALLVISVGWTAIVLFFSNQNLAFRERVSSRVRIQIIDFLMLSGAVSVGILLFNIELYSRLMIFGTIGIFFLLRNFGYVALYQYLRIMRQRGRHMVKVLVLGAGRVGTKVYRFMVSNPALGYRVIGFLDDDFVGSDTPVELQLGPLDILEGVIEKYDIDEVYLALPVSAEEKIKSVVDIADFHGIRIRLIPDYYRIFNASYVFHRVGDLPIVNVREVPLDNLVNKLLKRLFDLIFASCVLVILSPVLMVISLLILFESPGPVFYVPERIGQGGRPFKCFKFRSMRQNAPAQNNTQSTVKDDPRVTRIGRFMRKYSIDEMPQFINVLLSDMSVVGPRPHRTLLNEDFQRDVDGYMIRHYIKPGITGWAQVNGWRGPTETYDQKYNRTKHDLWYIENWSLWLDFKVVFLTVFGKKVHENAF
jgi:Undecaprenyl-phosphate glucose phosphotransferase